MLWPPPPPSLTYILLQPEKALGRRGAALSKKLKWEGGVPGGVGGRRLHLLQKPPCGSQV